MSSPAQAAQEYARRGLPVFPLRPRGKEPLTSHGYRDATTDAEQIRHWWQTHPAANIGLAIPRGLVVVDLDDREALLRLKAEDRDLPATAKSVTARGFHLFYRTDKEIRSAVKLLPGVDLRGVGGYVVVPPSVHPSGARYRWEVPLVRSKVADVPEWVVEATAGRSTQRCQPAEQWRRITMNGVGKGQRNDTLASLAGHLLRRGVDPFVVLELMVAWNATRCRPPLSEREVSRTVDSIAGRELRRRGRCA